MRYILVFGMSFAAAVFFVGCSTPVSQQLKMAEEAYSQAKNDPSVSKEAPVDLHEAEKDLEKARAAEDLSDQEHYAYLAEKKTELARTRAKRASAREQASELKQQQEKFLSTIHQREAEQAKMEARIAREQLQAIEVQKRQQELIQSQAKAQEAQEELERLQQELKDIKSRQTEYGIVLTLSGVIFAFDKADLKPGAVRSLGRLADFLKEHPDWYVLVEGFTDNVGSASYNRVLSQRRAESVAAALEAKGVSQYRIATRGLGEDYPVAPNNTEAGRQQNRRVEITVLKPGQEPNKAGHYR